MIDEEMTVRMFGYTSDMLAHQSHKKIVVMCDECGVYRLIEHRHRDSDLCKSCINLNRWKDDNQRKQLIDAQLKRYEDPKERQKQSDGLKRRYSNPKERQKQSDAQKLHYKNNPRRAKKHSKFMMGNSMSEEARQKSRDAQKGIPMSEEAKQRLSATHQGIPYEEWESFAKDQLYCPKFNESCRESNREKYGRRCFICGKPESENITKTGKVRKLSVHHCDMDKGQGCDGVRWKLIPLCMEHHGVAHNELWTARIVYLLNHVWDSYKQYSNGEEAFLKEYGWWI